VQTERLLASPPPIPSRYEIANVPFYPQLEYFCGPATLAQVFSYYGKTVMQEALAPDLFTPGLKGTLQIEMVAATRQQGYLAYAQQGSLEQLLSLVSEDIPVVVLQNVSIPWYPMWHYALVIGYDLEKQELLMHSGDMAKRKVAFKVFERTWQRGKFWFLAAVPAGRSSEYFEPFIYASAAQDLLAVGQVSAGLSALVAATKQWPEYWLPYFLLGNHFLANHLVQANYWYQRGYEYGKTETSLLNNYAYVLHTLGCHEQALGQIDEAISLAPGDANLQDTQRQIISEGVVATCPIPGEHSVN
jgi:tetratricopeptide (TPR) repeat protein